MKKLWKAKQKQKQKQQKAMKSNEKQWKAMTSDDKLWKTMKNWWVGSGPVMICWRTNGRTDGQTD